MKLPVTGINLHRQFNLMATIWAVSRVGQVTAVDGIKFFMPGRYCAAFALLPALSLRGYQCVLISLQGIHSVSHIKNISFIFKPISNLFPSILTYLL